MKPWVTLARRKVLDHAPYLTVEMHTVRLPDGRVIPDWPWVITPDFVTIVAETVEGRFLCFRQTKYALKRPSLAMVGGFIEPGEPPRTAARRELLEETGHTAATWTSLGRYVVDGNRGAGTAYFFLAREARLRRPPTGGDLEEQELLFLTRKEMQQALEKNKFRSLTWASIVALALNRLGR